MGNFHLPCVPLAVHHRAANTLPLAWPFPKLLRRIYNRVLIKRNEPQEQL
jgi:hypothetical protein